MPPHSSATSKICRTLARAERRLRAEIEAEVRHPPLSEYTPERVAKLIAEANLRGSRPRALILEDLS